MSVEKMLEKHEAYDKERFESLERKLDDGKARMDGIDSKLDVLVAAANKQKGFLAGVSAAFSMLATAVVGLIVYIWQKHFGG